MKISGNWGARIRRVLILAAVFCYGITGAPSAEAITVYVSNEKDNTISVIDGDTYKVTATIAVGQRPRGIILSHNKTELYICASDSDHIEVLDLKTLKITKSLHPAPTPGCSSYTPTAIRSTLPMRTTT
jgi:YVTN family beta-propeller protein